MAYYNTTNKKGKDLDTAVKKSLTQNELIENWFKANKGEYTPLDVQRAVLPGAPLTSVRRALHTLTIKDVLVKTSTQRMGAYGAMNYCWEYNN
jgi:hypothetical protein